MVQVLFDFGFKYNEDYEFVIFVSNVVVEVLICGDIVVISLNFGNFVFVCEVFLDVVFVVVVCGCDLLNDILVVCKDLVEEIVVKICMVFVEKGIDIMVVVFQGEDN